MPTQMKFQLLFMFSFHAINIAPFLWRGRSIWQFLLAIDSGIHVGPFPIAFESRKLKDPEQLEYWC
uniref:Uncharacterized protein n=1 Tax=Utricularia reniformis TaxID=192314 RepID=A0A1Y0AZ91_9LAMI|nr:hypothetical protein AEK19_MT0169 [Utricularia reniformis]ART30451.1 hypothetical protein AEK19_MT0169 [Utricularia reniformis]